MTSNIFHMSINEMGTALGIGALCALVYLNLLWQTVHLLPRVRHKGFFLFVSMGLRIFLLLAVMVLLSDNKAGRFILIFCGFVVVRLLILRFTRLGGYRLAQDKQIQKSLKKGGR